MNTGLIAAGIALLCVTGPAPSSFAGTAADNDGDGIYNVLDNCVTNSNDFTQKFVKDFPKGKDSGIGDMDCNGVVNSGDFVQWFIRNFAKGKPGPSGLHCAGHVPCDL